MINKKQRHWKVKYGHRPTEYVSIEEGGELEKAIYAQRTGTPVQLSFKFIKGTHIMSIEPNYHIHTGWNDFYEPTDGNDWEQIKRDCPNYDGILEQYKIRVVHLIQTNQTHLIGKNLEIPTVNSSQKRVLSEGSKTLADKFSVNNDL